MKLLRERIKTESSASEQPSSINNPGKHHVTVIIFPIVFGMFMIVVAVYCHVQRKRAKAAAKVAAARQAGDAPASVIYFVTAETCHHI